MPTPKTYYMGVGVCVCACMFFFWKGGVPISRQNHTGKPTKSSKVWVVSLDASFNEREAVHWPTEHRGIGVKESLSSFKPHHSVQTGRECLLEEGPPFGFPFKVSLSNVSKGYGAKKVLSFLLPKPI